MTEHEAAGSAAHVDPEIVVLVESIRDRFGLKGLRQAAALIDEEIVRFEAEVRDAFAEE
jgi:hypothetical protein